MDLTFLFITALLMAFLTFLISVIFGKRVAWIIGLTGALSVVLPLVMIIVLGIMGMLERGADSGQVASNTIGSIIRYMAENLPELVISAVAGAIVGFILGWLMKITPRRISRKIARRMRIT